MKESSFWSQRLRPHLQQACAENDWKCHFERVENAVATGTPDVDYCIDGHAGKLELKYSPRHPTRQSTPVLGTGNGLRRSQVIWIARRLYAGGRVFVAIGTPKSTWIINVAGMTPVELASLEVRTAPALRGISAWCADSHPWCTLPLTLVR